MAVVKNLIVRAGADFSALKKEMDKAKQQMRDFKNKMDSAVSGVGVALAGLGVGLGIGAAVKDAMRFEASIQQLNRLMGQSAGEFMKWADTTAVAFNMSKSEAIQYGATYSNIISTFAKSTQETQVYTQDLLKATAVAASMTGRTMEDALERVRSGMLGNTEAIEDLGIFVNVAMIESTKAFQQFANGKSWDQLNFQTQQQIRLFAILEQAATKYGVEVGNNAISATARFVAQLNNLKLAIGQAFQPIWEAVLPGLTAMAAWLTKVMNVVAQFMQVLFGKAPAQSAKSQANANSQVASSVGTVGDAYKKAGKEAKKAQGFLAGFDEVNSVADKSSSGSGSSGDEGAGTDVAGMAEIPALDFETNAPQISENIREMAERVRGFFSNAKSLIIEHKDAIISALAGIGAGLATYAIATNGSTAANKVWNAIALVTKSILNGLKAAWLALIGPVGLIVAAVAGLTAAFVYFYRTNDKFKGFVDGIFNKIKEAASYLWQNVLVPFGEWLGKQFVAAWEETKKAAEWLWKNVLVPFGDWLEKAFVASWDAVKKASEWLWKNVLVPFGDFLKQMWTNVLLPLSAVLSDVLAVAFKFVTDVAKSLWTNVLIPLADFFNANFKPTIEAITAVLTYLWTYAFQPLGKYLGEVFIALFKLLTITIQFLWNNVLKPLLPFLKNEVDTAFVTIGNTIEGLKTTFKGLMNFITGVFTGDWEKAWNGVKDIFKGVFESLYGFVKAPLNRIIDAINQVISGLNSISIDVPDWVPEFGGKKFGISIPRIPRLARGGIVSSTTNMGNYIAGEAGSEMIVPLENTSFVDKLASALGTAVMTAMSFSQESANKSGDLVIQLDGTTLGRVLNPYLAKESNRVGNSVIKTT